MLTPEALTEKAGAYLGLLSAQSNLGLPPEGLVQMYEEVLGEKLLCKVRITGIEYGLGRAKAADREDRNFYIPVFGLRGTAEYYGEESGTLYLSSTEYEPESDLVWIGAMDGGELTNVLARN